MKKYEGKLIFKGEDQRGVVEVAEDSFLRYLHFGTAIQQSSMFLDDPFTLEMECNRMMMLPLLFHSTPCRVLFLGLGGGSKLKFLWKYFPECTFDVVEWSPLVIDVGHRFFAVPDDPRIHIYCDEAYGYLKKAPQNEYDLIFVDLYIADQISPSVGTDYFFYNCQKSLKPNGIVCWNMWRKGIYEQQKATIENMVQTFGKDFLVLPNSESPNFTIILFKTLPVPVPLSDIKYNAQRLQEKTALNFTTLLDYHKNFEGWRHLFKN